MDISDDESGENSDQSHSCSNRTFKETFKKPRFYYRQTSDLRNSQSLDDLQSKGQDDEEEFESELSRKFMSCKNSVKTVSCSNITQISTQVAFAEWSREKEIIHLQNINNSNFEKNLKICSNYSKIKELIFSNCYVKFKDQKVLSTIKTLRHLSFNKCDGDFYKLFDDQKSVEKITIENEDQIIDGFSHEDFNELVSKLPNVKHIVLKGAGTTSYFSHGKYPFKIVILETDVISFNTTKHQAVDNESNDLLKSQNSTLKELRIKNLPSGSIGSDIIKFIFEDMKLKNFYYGNKGLIVNFEKKIITELSANAEQIHGCIELLGHIKGVKTLIIILNETDLDIKETINICTSKNDALKNITEMRVIDKSGYMRLLNVFQELFVNLASIQKFVVESQDKNINAILDYCLKEMKELVELHIDSRAPRVSERLTIIRNNSNKLKKLFVDKELNAQADLVFNGKVKVDAYKPCNSHYC